MANIQPKDPVTLGLTSQRELDAAVAKAQKAAGTEAPTDTRFDSDREALIEQLRAEREQHHRDAEAALAAAEAEAVEVVATRSSPASRTRSSVDSIVAQGAGVERWNIRRRIWATSRD